jgi:hypothetical protein
MKKNWRMSDVRKLPAWAQAQINAQLAGNPNPQPQRPELEALVRKAPPQTSLVNIPGKVLVRITRVSPRRLDDDNLSGGCKELRDAIAAMLGRKDDSENSNLGFFYSQRIGTPETKIEIMEVPDAR